MLLQMGVAKFTHHTVVVFYAIGIVVLLYRPVNRLYISSTSFGSVDHFKGNYSATGRGNSSSGRGKSITPIDVDRSVHL